ncbi:hypothetical protein ACFVAJ_17385 [Agromyces sp. NPDC057679]|uniref:hypothetical protein n=1 Tax=Agromyces sp. NPDC057679 TaxID=3346207 RepID=UPI00366BA42D
MTLDEIRAKSEAELAMIGKRVLLMTGLGTPESPRRVRAKGVLRYVPARTRGNQTLAVCGRRREVLWMWRDRQGFELELARQPMTQQQP